MTTSVYDHDTLTVDHRRGPFILGRDRSDWRIGAHLHVGPLVFDIQREIGWAAHIMLMGRGSIKVRWYK